MAGSRVVVTGRGAVSPYGVGCDSFQQGLWEGRGAVVVKHEWKKIDGLYSWLAAPVPDFDFKQLVPRKYRRTMGPMALYATIAAMEAVDDAALEESVVNGGMTGIAVGSTTGSPCMFEEFYRKYLPDETVADMRSGIFFKIMGHSCSANVALALGIGGEQWAPSSACTSSAQAIGLGYILVASGRQKVMLCGGADEIHSTVTMVFDVLHAASRKNDAPNAVPSPFDACRDGVVCGAGAGMLVLEEYEHALARGVEILAEIKGFGNVNDFGNVAAPGADVMCRAMCMAMDEAGVAPEEIDYVSAHATGTGQGDIAEAVAVSEAVGNGVAVSSLKGHIGHTLGAAGALEVIALLEMMHRGEILPTLNLVTIDPDIAGLPIDLVRGKPLPGIINTALKNNFALGGVNTSLVFRRI